MNLSLLILCVSFILVLFNVGESVYFRLKLKKWLLLLVIASLILLRFIPSININGVTFSIANFIAPVFLSVLIACKNLNKGKTWLKFFVSSLVVITFTLIYNVADLNVYESSLLQPYDILAIILGFLCFVITNNPKIVFLSSVVGLTVSELIFYKSRYEVYGYYNLTLGSEMMICVLLIEFLTSLFALYLVRKIKAYKLKKRKKNKKLLET